MRCLITVSRQGQSYFRDFARDVQTLAKRFRLEWMKACCSPESTSLKELIRRAIHFEAAELTKRKENGVYTHTLGMHLELLCKLRDIVRHLHLLHLLQIEQG